MNTIVSKIKFNTFSAVQIADTSRPGLNPIEYSRFKFGSKSIARKYGYHLAEEMIMAGMIDASPNVGIVVCSSPYSFIPTATFAMKDYFIQRLNRHLSQFENTFSVEEAKIYRTLSYHEDYGSMDADQRMAMIGNDDFYVDALFLKGKKVIFLDDIRITGGHEKVMLRMVQKMNLECEITFAYYASLTDPASEPSYENVLNHAYVRTLKDVDNIIKDDEFLPNTRVVKFILNYADQRSFENFIDYQSQRTISNIYHLALGNNYHRVDRYRSNMAYIINALKKYGNEI